MMRRKGCCIVQQEKERTGPAADTLTGSRVTATAKALKVLDCFAPSQTELTLAQISRLLEIPKSTLLNQIRTLEEAGFLMRVRDGQAYRLGYKIMELSYCAHTAMPVVQYAVPVMEDLQVATGEIIYLTSHIGGRAFYLECVYPSRRSIAYSVAGKTLPMHCTGCGKAMLSQMPTEQVEEIIQKHGLPPVTQNTITDHDKLMECLAVYRRKGYALDNEEETMGVKCVAMAIRTGRGDVAGALSISGSTLSIRTDNIEQYAELLSRACNTLSQHAYLFPALQVEAMF